MTTRGRVSVGPLLCAPRIRGLEPPVWDADAAAVKPAPYPLRQATMLQCARSAFVLVRLVCGFRVHGVPHRVVQPVMPLFYCLLAYYLCNKIYY